MLRWALALLGLLTGLARAELGAIVELPTACAASTAGDCGGTKLASHLTANGPTLQPLLCLTMIVKDEASSIQAVLRNAFQFVDRWAILDTGSTDGTQELIREVAREFPLVYGKLYEEPFVDFSTSRNRILELAGLEATFTITLDGDWYIHDPQNDLRPFLRQRASAGTDGYLMRVNQQNFALDYYSARILRTAHRIRYVGVVHEVPDGNLSEMVPAHIMLNWSATAENQQMSVARWERDRLLLERDFSLHPNSSRTSFYLAQTYGCLMLHELAIAMYTRRIALGGWAEETFMAHFRRAQHTQSAGHPWHETMTLLLEAWRFRPTRAEPLYEIARHYNKIGQLELCGLFATKAYAIPHPGPEALFVQKVTYDVDIPDLVSICAWYSGDYEAGLKAAEHMLALRPTDVRARFNIAFYLQHFGKPIPQEVSEAVALVSAEHKNP